jgi:hypothetical protein
MLIPWEKTTIKKSSCYPKNLTETVGSQNKIEELQD